MCLVLFNGAAYLFLEWDSSEFNNVRMQDNWLAKITYTFWLSWNYFTCGPTPAEPSNFCGKFLSGMWGITTLVFRAWYTATFTGYIIDLQKQNRLILNTNDLQDAGGSVVMFDSDPTVPEIRASYPWMKIQYVSRSEIKAEEDLNGFLANRTSQVLLTDRALSSLVVENSENCDVKITETLSFKGAGFITRYTGCRSKINWVLDAIMMEMEVNGNMAHIRAQYSHGVCNKGTPKSSSIQLTLDEVSGLFIFFSATALLILVIGFTSKCLFPHQDGLKQYERELLKEEIFEKEKEILTQESKGKIKQAEAKSTFSFARLRKAHPNTAL